MVLRPNFKVSPIKAMVQAIKEGDCRALFPASRQGLCLQPFDVSGSHLVESTPYVKAGFMHIPCMMEQVVNRPTTPNYEFRIFGEG